MALSLRISAPNISEVLASFDVLRVERSVTGSGGPYSELTAPMATPAALLGSTSSPFDVVGKTFEFKPNNSPNVVVTFSGGAPLSIAQVVSQINAAAAQTIAYDASGALNLESSLVGTVSSVEIIGGTALADLGFVAGARDIGEEPYVPLVSGITSYAFIDNDGEAAYVYRSWYFNTSTLLESARSAPFEGTTGSLISAGSLSVAVVDVVDVQGVPIEGQRVVVHPLFRSTRVEGMSVSRAPVVAVTNASGHAEMSLVRGAHVRVVFEGTGVVRDIVVPDAPTFNLWDVVASAPDGFGVVSPILPGLPRRTL